MHISAGDLRGELRAMARKVKNWERPLRVWAVETGRDINEAWDKMTYRSLYSGPKMFRGVVMWDRLKPQYVRKDGTVVPPWGGVKRVIGKGRVLGRLRSNSKTRVKPTSIVGKDTGNMARQFTGEGVLSADKRSISLVTNVEYAEEQNRLRHFAVLGDKDVKRLDRIVRAYLRALILSAQKIGVAA